MTTLDRIELLNLLSKKRSETISKRKRESVVALFEKQAVLSAKKIACIDGNEAISYESLNARANQLMNGILASGIKPGASIGIFSSRSINYIACILGIFKANACYIALDPNYPENYLANIAKNSKPSVILSSESLKNRAILEFRDSVVLSIESQINAGHSKDNRLMEISPEELASIAYTSGSTGVPKGVMIPHSQVENWLHGIWDLMPILETEVVAQKTSAAFVVSLKEMLVGLLAGSSQIIFPDHVVKDPVAFLLALEESKITRINLVPSHLKALLGRIESTGQNLPALRYCTTAGEPLIDELLKEAKEKLPHVHFWNNYGCTELNDISYHSTRSSTSDSPYVSIGRQIENTRVFILSPELEKVAKGEAGELCVEGANLSHGYLNAPSLTAEKYVPNPFSAKPGTRLYRTGDIARHTDDGSIEYLGRYDFEVKIRGQRVDMRHVEHVLAQHPQASQSVVMGRDLGDDVLRLVAYCVRPEGEPLDSYGIRQFLGGHLPDFMVPQFYVRIEELPRLPNGKINRKALPTPSAQNRFHEVETPPCGPIEIWIANCWIEILKLQAADRHDKFFELGGDSLSGSQFTARIQENYGVTLPFTELFSMQTIEAIAIYIEKSLASPSTTEEQIVRVSRE